MASGMFLDRSDRAKLRFTGEQRAWFLDQILTQTFEDLAPGLYRDAALLTVHGRMQGYMEFLATEEALLCHFEPDLRSSLPAELEKYVFATRVEIDDVTDDYGLVLVLSEDAAAAAGDAPTDVHVHPTGSLGVPAAYLWVDVADLPKLLDHVSGLGFEATTEAAVEAIRIRNGVPRWGLDMDRKTFPQEAGIDAAAVQYEKGCYLGQEAMAKIHFRGKVNRRLVRLEGEGPIERGAEVTAEGGRLGNVTSSADSVALAMVKYTTEAGTSVEVGSVPARVVG